MVSIAVHAKYASYGPVLSARTLPSMVDDIFGAINTHF